MQTLTRHLLRRIRWGGRLLVMASVVLAIAVSASASAKAAPSAAPAAAPALSTLPPTTCTEASGTRTCELWAKTGTIDLPGLPGVPIWAYSDTSDGAATLPGPMLIVNEGETVQVILHNTLAEASSLSFPGQSLTPDTTGVASGADNTASPYTFVASHPGTYLYEAGLTANGQTQVAMGLFGALIVRPAGHADWAYGAASAFNDEALLVLSEVDPAFNTDPANFNMREYAPKYWLINGKAYPDTDPIGTASGNTLLLRYVNAGLEHHSMGLLGVHQTVIANDGSVFAHSYEVVAETVAAGQTLDTIVTLPAASPARYPLYSASLHVDNAGAYAGDGGGGMTTFVEVP